MKTGYATADDVLSGRKFYCVSGAIVETAKPIRTNCNNCGAPLNNGKCEYCGTDYGHMSKLVVGGLSQWYMSDNPSDIIVCQDPLKNVMVVKGESK